jgi:hypothetical protein
MTDNTAQLTVESPDETLDRQINETRHFIRHIDLFLSFFSLLTILLAVLFAAVLADHWFFADGLSLFLRLGIFAVLLFIIAFYIYRRIVPLLLYPINPVYAASLLEESTPSLKNSIVNWILLRKERLEQENYTDKLAERMFDGVTQTAVSSVNKISSERAVDLRCLTRWGIALTLCFLFFVVYALFSPKNPLTSLARIILPISNIEKPQAIRFQNIEPGNTVALQGEKLTISAEVIGQSHEPVYLFFSTDDGQFVRQAIPMSLPEGKTRYEISFPPGKQGFTSGVDYWIAQDDSRSKTFRIEVRPAATIEIVSLKYRFPPYTGLPDETIENSGDIRAVEGTEVKIGVRSTIPLQRIDIVFDNDPVRIVGMKLSDNNPLEATAAITMKLDPKNTSSTTIRNFLFRATDLEGYESRRSGIFRLEVLPDQPPQIQWADTDTKLKDVAQLDLPLNNSLELPIQAEDRDFGLRYLRLHVESGNKQIRPVELLESPATGPTEYKGSIQRKAVFSPITSRLAEGDSAEIWAEAVDTKFPDPNNATTRRITVRIIAPQKQNQQPPKENEQNSNDNDDNKEKQNKEQDKKQNKNKEQDNNNNNNNDEEQQENNHQEQEKNQDSQNNTNDREQEDREREGRSNDESPEKSEGNEKNNKENSNENSKEQNNEQTGEKEEQQKSGDTQDGQNIGEQGKESGERNGSNELSREPSDTNENTSSNNNKDRTGKTDKTDSAKNNSEQKNNGLSAKNAQQNNISKKPVNPETQDGDAMEEILKQMKKDGKFDDKKLDEQNSNNQDNNNNQNNNDQDNNDQNNDNQNGNNQKDNNQNRDQQNNNEQPKNQKETENQTNSKQTDTNKTDSKQTDSTSDSKPETQDQNEQGSEKQNSEKQGSEKQNSEKQGSEKQSSEKQGESDSNQENSQPNGTNQTDTKNSEQANNNGKEHSPNQKDDFNNGNDNRQNEPGSEFSEKQGNTQQSGDQVQDVPVDPADKTPRRRDDSLDPNSTEHSNQGGDSSNPQKSDVNKPNDSASGGDESKGVKTKQQEQNSQTQSVTEQGKTADKNENKNGTEKQNGSEEKGTAGKQLDNKQNSATKNNQSEGNKSDSGESGNSNQSNSNQDNSNQDNSNQDNSNQSNSNQGPNQSDLPPSANSASGKNQSGKLLPEPSSNSSANTSATGSQGSSALNIETPAEDPNLEYTKKVTNLVLEYLEDQLKTKPNQELLDNLGWTEKELRDFHRKWREMSEQSKHPESNTSNNNTQWKEAFKSLGLKSSQDRQQLQKSRTGVQDKNKVTESQRFAPPSAIKERFKLYTEGIGK